jgi:hypothetical protein
MNIQHFWYSENAEKLGGIMIYEANGKSITCTKVCDTKEEGDEYIWSDKIYLGAFENAELIWEGIVY